MYVVLREFNIINQSISSVVAPPTYNILCEAYEVFACGSFFKQFDYLLVECITVNISDLICKCVIVKDASGKCFVTMIPEHFEHS